jgi:signal transduction histidine kinase/CheY-like chemotaxis protein
MQSADTARACVLILAPIGRDAAAAAELLTRVGLRPCICKDFAELAGKIDADVAAVVLAEEALFGKPITALCDWVAGQPPWSDLPFVVLTGHLPNPGLAALRQRLTTSLRNVSLLERPVQAITITTAVQAAVRARARQYEVRALLEAQQHAAVELERLVLARTHQLQAANEKLLEQIRERAQIEESLRQAQKMEAIGQLTGGIAHDFNNLLMVVLGGLTMLERSTDTDRRQLLIHGIRQAAQRGAALTRQLLAFSRRQSLQPQAVDLAGRIRGMRELLERSLGGQIHVELLFAEDLWPVHVDAGEFELVVLNLVVNARDAMPEGGTIKIHADNLPPSVLGELQGDYVRLTVIDSGVGMTAEVMERAFEPFFTTKEVGKGSGLGLAQVYGFIKQSGGSVQIHSEPGRGTSITLLLPRSSGRAHEASYEDFRRAQFIEQSAAGSVLLVEDNDEVAALVSEMLRELGYEVERVSSAPAALEVLAASAVDLVFSDIMMPGGMDGVELGRQIRLRSSNIPVLLTSGYAHGAVQRAESEGFRVLAKPYDLASLARALRGVSEDRIGAVAATATAAASPRLQ